MEPSQPQNAEVELQTKVFTKVDVTLTLQTSAVSTTKKTELDPTQPVGILKEHLHMIGVINFPELEQVWTYKGAELANNVCLKDKLVMGGETIVVTRATSQSQPQQS